MITPKILPSMGAYILALQRMDWHYAYSDDGSVYRRGRDAMQALISMRQDVDPEGVVWAQHAQ